MYDPSDTGFSNPLTPNLTNPGKAEVYQVDLSFTIGNLTAGEAGFGSSAFDIGLTGSLTPAVAFGPYSAADNSNPSVSYKKSGKAVSDYSGDADSGVSSTDLKAIAFYLANPPYAAYSSSETTGTGDTRAQLGQNSPAYFGTAYVQWDGTVPSVLSFQNVQYATYAPGGTTFGTANNALDTNTVVFGTPVGTPEPASLGVLALGGVALLNRRRKA